MMVLEKEQECKRVQADTKIDEINTFALSRMSECVPVWRRGSSEFLTHTQLQLQLPIPLDLSNVAVTSTLSLSG